MRVFSEIRDSVCFVYLEKTGGSRVAVATAFFVGSTTSVYLVTARHVLAQIQASRPDGQFLLRLNSHRPPGVAWVPSSIANWHTHPDGALADDVAVCPWSFSAPALIRSVALRNLATAQLMADYDVGVGDEVFFPGLFVNHAGKHRNIPIVRIGNIAAMPEEPVATKHFGDMEAYLIEARSIGGLSGSPAFLNLGLYRRIGTEIQAPPSGHGVALLLGLVHGHYAVDAPSGDEAMPDGLSNETINMGIAIVVPGSRILEIVEHIEGAR